jgi:hypothetical protein
MFTANHGLVAGQPNGDVRTDHVLGHEHQFLSAAARRWRRLQSTGRSGPRIDSRLARPDPEERRTISAMAEWWSIEVLHGEFSAFRWQEQHDSALIEAALTNGAVDGAWHADRWGVVFEVCFENEERWETFRSLPTVRAALDGVPDPVSGLLVYRGRGGGAGAREPRKPRPAPGASAATLPEPQAVPLLDLTGISPPDPAPAGTTGGLAL